MDSSILIVLTVTLSVAFIASMVVFAVIVYHQMLLFNEINKRLLVKSMEDQEKYEGALVQLAEAERTLEEAAQSVAAPKGPLDDSDMEIHDIGLDE